MKIAAIEDNASFNFTRPAAEEYFLPEKDAMETGRNLAQNVGKFLPHYT
jgi:hypothetical protein